MINKTITTKNSAIAFALAITALFIVNAGPVAADKSAADIVDDNQLSIVRLYIEISADAIYPDPIFDQYTLSYTPSTINRKERITATAHCSGFVITPDGYIATANHCVFFTNDDLDGILMDAVLALVYQSFSGELGTYDISSLPEGAVDRVQYVMEQLFYYLYQYVRFDNIDVRWFVSPSKEAVGSGSYELVNSRQPAIATFGGGLPAPGQIVAPEDIAFLKINQKNLKPVVVGDADELRTGENLYAVGYPWIVDPEMTGTPNDELVPTLTGGLLSAKRQNEYGIDLLQLDVQLAGGNSGGPVFDSNGEAVGVASFGFGENVNYNFAVSSNVLKDFMTRNNMPINTGAPAVQPPTTPPVIAPPTIPPVGQQTSTGGGMDMTLIIIVMIIIVAVVIVVALVLMRGKGVGAGSGAANAPSQASGGGGPSGHNFCPVCRATIKASDKFCENCGSTL